MDERRARAILALAATICLGTPLGVSAGQARSVDIGEEILRIRVVNDRAGAVSISHDVGRSWRDVGRVLTYTIRVNRDGFTASKWVSPGCVAATSVNAIHINAGYNEKDDRGVVFSILPREFASPPDEYRSYLSPGASIQTDIPAGDSIFGGGDAPLVGSRVFVERHDGSAVAIDESYVPRRSDTLTILVARPSRYPIATVFENRPGGAIRLLFADGAEKFLGWVVRPVGGVGRFAGSLYAGIGRIRAAHAGVIDVSTSPVGSLGAFQIIPVGHALSPEMHRAWELTQWMIVGPAEGGPTLWDALTPLFYQHLRPDYHRTDLISPEWRERMLSRFLVDVDTGSGWAPMRVSRLAPDPAAPLPAGAHDALAGVKRIRILFPCLLPPDAVQKGAAR